MQAAARQQQLQGATSDTEAEVNLLLRYLNQLKATFVRSRTLIKKLAEASFFKPQTRIFP